MGDWSTKDRARLAEHRRVRDHNAARYYAAFTAYEYIKSWEALGRTPEMKQVKGGKSAADFLDRSDPPGAWQRLADATLKVVDDPELQRAGAESASPRVAGLRNRREAAMQQWHDRDPGQAGAPPASAVPDGGSRAETSDEAAPAKRRGFLRRLLDS